MILKFRAWHKKEKKMFPVQTIFITENRVEWTVFVDHVTITGAYLDDIELMQSTGLKDKNGKEIFEGDIVKRGIDNLYTEEWDEDIQLIEIPNVFWMPYNELEIIGNKWENPKLLESD